MNIKYKIYGIFGFIGIILMTSCQSAGVNSTGSEYMPDMAHSVAYESNVYGYYYNNRWGTEDEFHKMVQPRNPVNGTIARGYAGGINPYHSASGVAYKANGSVPYYYGDTEAERERATKEIISNPYPITSAGIEKGKLLYNIQCAICHGEKGDGAGYLLRDDGGKYPVQPANFMLDTFINSSNGRYYHAIMYGRNLMGGYADKLSYEERWNVIQYIRSLQALSKKLEYNENTNTLNKADIPYSAVAAKMPAIISVELPKSDTITIVKEPHDKNSKH